LLALAPSHIAPGLLYRIEAGSLPPRLISLDPLGEPEEVGAFEAFGAFGVFEGTFLLKRNIAWLKASFLGASCTDYFLQNRSIFFIHHPR
jgi:hypothetical protein